ncbi:MAG: diguanylate cyclase [Halodesulfovibrio sp.]
MNSFYKGILDSLSDGVYFIDTSMHITYWNKAAERITGYTAAEVIGRSCSDNLLRHIDELGTQLCITSCPMRASVRHGQSSEVSVYLHHKLGHRIPISVRASPMRDEQGTIIGAVEIFNPTKERNDVINELEQLRNEVLRDPLTGIGNRRYADITLGTFESAQTRDQVSYGVLWADIDFFKTINDTWGHPTGDAVLVTVAQSLQSGLRSFDVVCRSGGEEFLILVPNVTLEALLSLAERLRVLVENSWIERNGVHIGVTASFGGTMARKGEHHDSVLARADAQLYLSKQGGRNCVHVIA